MHGGIYMSLLYFNGLKPLFPTEIVALCGLNDGLSLIYIITGTIPVIFMEN